MPPILCFPFIPTQALQRLYQWHNYRWLPNMIACNSQTVNYSGGWCEDASDARSNWCGALPHKTPAHINNQKNKAMLSMRALIVSHLSSHSSARRIHAVSTESEILQKVRPYWIIIVPIHRQIVQIRNSGRDEKKCVMARREWYCELWRILYVTDNRRCSLPEISSLFPNSNGNDQSLAALLPSKEMT